jgi:hypothetical protein
MSLFVGFQKVELSTTSSEISPRARGGLTGDEWNLSACCIAVACSVLGSSLVSGIFCRSSILIHLNKVDGCIHTALKGGQVDIKSDFSVEHFEHLVFGVAL